MKADGSISIWFFIGLSLLVNGALICGAGLYELVHPPQYPGSAVFVCTPNIWWGGLLVIVGILYCYRFFAAPGAARERQQS